MGQISKDVIEFVNQASEIFQKDIEKSTYRNKEYIALRTGLRDDCILVYELGEEIGNFVQWIPRDE